MTLQDDVVGLLMSLTNQTLFTTVSITNALLRWVVASTPRVAESVATVLGKYSPLAYAADTAASPNTNNYYVTLLESYSKIINTVMLVFAVWSVLKTAAFVWKSLLTLWGILTTVWTLLTWVGAGLRNVAQRCGWRRHQRDKEEEEGTEDCVATDEASHYHDAVPERSITATHTNSGQYYSFEQADNQPSVSTWGFPVPGVTWYYQNPGTEKIVPWITPPQVPVPPQAQMIPFNSPNTATTVEYSHPSAPSKPPAASPSVAPDVLDDRGKTGHQRVRTSHSMVHVPSPPVFSPSRKLSHGGVDWSMNLDQPFGREDSNNEASSSSFAESTHLARTATMEIPTLVTTSQLPITAATGTTPHEQATTEKGAIPSDENLKKRKAVSAATVAVGDEPRVEEQEAAIIITTLQDREVEEELYVDRPAKKHKHGHEGSLHDSNSGEDEDYMKF